MIDLSNDPLFRLYEEKKESIVNSIVEEFDRLAADLSISDKDAGRMHLEHITSIRQSLEDSIPNYGDMVTIEDARTMRALLEGRMQDDAMKKKFPDRSP